MPDVTLMRLLLRALIAFLALPGVVAFLAPLLILWATGAHAPTHPLGLVVLVLGTSGLLWCVREFYVAGRGTLAPWAPPRTLVVTGPYRYSRNPMYIAVPCIVLGWASTCASGALVAYALALLVGFDLRIRFGEEPWLARMHGDAWTSYARRVPRWL